MFITLVPCTSDLSFSQLQFLVLDFFYYYYNFFFFALNECDAISSQCNSLTMYSIRGVGVYLVGMLASAEVA